MNVDIRLYEILQEFAHWTVADPLETPNRIEDLILKIKELVCDSLPKELKVINKIGDIYLEDDLQNVFIETIKEIKITWK
jgi:hypothetical protein